MELSGLKEKYVKSLAEIEKECFECPWTENAFLKDTTNENALYSVAGIRGKVVGYIGGYIVFDTVYINNIAVSKECRNQGIGTALLNDFIVKSGSRILTLEVRKSNVPAINLYKKFAFEVVGERRGFYSKPKEDALIMTRMPTVVSANSAQIHGNS